MAKACFARFAISCLPTGATNGDLSVIAAAIIACK